MAAALDIVPVPVAEREPAAGAPLDAAEAIAAVEWKSVRRFPEISFISCFQCNAGKVK